MYYDCTPAVQTPEVHGSAGSRAAIPAGPLAEHITSELVILGAAGVTTDGERLNDQLDALIGPVRVVEVDPAKGTQSLAGLLLGSSDSPVPPRLLLKLTDAYNHGCLPVATQGLISDLLKHELRLLGSDLRQGQWPLANALGSNLAEQGILFLEGLDLRNVPPGDYVLIALPVPGSKGGRCPVRVVLKAVI